LILVLTLGSPLLARPRVGQLPKKELARYRMELLDGSRLRLEDLRGKVVVLNFFAIWCSHSRDHLRMLARYGEDDRQRGLQIIGLAIRDSQSTPSQIRDLMGEFGLTYTVGDVADGDYSKLVESNDLSVPQTLVFGRDGRLAAWYHGHDERVERQLAATIASEMASPNGKPK